MVSVAAFTWTDGPNPNRHGGRTSGAKTVKHTRLDADDHISKMDQRLFCGKYRMDRPAFYKLLDILSPFLPSAGKKRNSPVSVPNGPISKSA